MSAVPADSRIASPWRIALPAFLVFAAAIALLYRETALGMVGIWWRSETFAHAFLVPPISLWLIWRQRDRLAVAMPRAEPWVLLPLLGVVMVWWLSALVVVDAATHFAFVALLVLAVAAVLGREVTSVILFPLAFLFFAVPFGEFVVPTMMQWTADFTVSALRASGVPVYREGQQFITPTGHWSVIDECSGVRYLMASFMVGTLFAYLNYRSFKRRAIFMLIALLVPILANWLRAYLIVMMAYLSGNRIATGVDHVIYGWVFFGVIIVAMFAIGAWWSEPASAWAQREPRPAGPRPPGARSDRSGAYLATALAGTLIALLPHLWLGVPGGAELAANPVAIELPARLSTGWSDDGARLADWTPTFASPSAETRRTYSGRAGTVGMYLAYYRGQNDKRKLVSSQNVLVAMRDHDWSLMASGTRRVTAGPATIDVRTAEILAKPKPGVVDAPRLVVWRVYWVDGRFFAGDVATKLATGWSQLRGQGDDGAALVLYAEDGPTHEATAALERFVDVNFDALDALLRHTHAQR